MGPEAATPADAAVTVPWHGMNNEGKLPTDAFVCYAGQIFGIRVPVEPLKGSAALAKSKKTGTGAFAYVKFRPIPRFQPIECYVDLLDDHRQFLVFPPVSNWSAEWRMVHRIESPPGSGWRQSRLFVIGDEHPCAADESHLPVWGAPPSVGPTKVRLPINVVVDHTWGEPSFQMDAVD